MKKYAVTKSFRFEGKRYFVHANTEHEAYEKMALKKRDLEENKITVESSMTVSDWAHKAIETYKTNQSRITREKYMRRAEHNVLDHIGSMKLKDVKPIHCQNVLNLCSGFSQRHINEVAQILKFIFQTAVDNKLIRENPADHVTRPTGKESHGRPASPEELSAFFEALKVDPRFILFELIYYCGCRPSEAMEVTSDDIRPHEDFHVLHIRATKNKYSDRLVPIPDDFYERLKDHHGIIASRANGTKHTRTSYRRLTERLYREMNIALGSRMYRNAIVEPKLSPDFVPYCLRHSYCTNLARSGVDVRVAQKLMGHSDIQTTVNIYTHIDESFLADAMNSIRGCHTGCHT